MADDNPSAPVPMNSAIPQDGQLTAPLQAAQQQFGTEVGKSYATDALARVQQHLNEINTVDANTAAGQHFSNTITGVQEDLTHMASADPTSVKLGVDLAHQLVSPLLGHVDEATRADIVGGIQRTVANAGILRMADVHADSAHAMVDQFSNIVGDEAVPILHNYIDTMHLARMADGAAVQDQQATQQTAASGVNAYQYGAKLLDPQSEAVVFPPDYLQGLVKTNAINPEDKTALFAAFNNLRTFGDAAQSNPNTVATMLSRIASPTDTVGHQELMDQVGRNLKYVDAQTLLGLTNMKTPEGVAQTQHLANIVQSARQQLMGTGGRDGEAAFGRFMDWFLPSLRNTGMTGLNPASDQYLFKNTTLARFAPQGADMVSSRMGPTKSLSDIFSGPSMSVAPRTGNPNTGNNTR